jgi:hypothetical protein
MRIHPGAHAGKGRHAGAKSFEYFACNAILRAQIFQPCRCGIGRVTTASVPIVNLRYQALPKHYDLGINLVDCSSHALFDMLRYFVPYVRERFRRQIVLVRFKGRDGSVRDKQGWQKHKQTQVLRSHLSDKESHEAVLHEKTFCNRRARK